jgi:23S rRNA pseudouridine1911/1915/1917 synthase
LDRGRPYRTEIIHWETRGEYTLFRLRIYRGFRHQIRCHLAWMGYPLLNDALYGGRICPDYPGLALRAQSISFPDPVTGEIREYTLPPISLAPTG